MASKTETALAVHISTIYVFLEYEVCFFSRELSAAAYTSRPHVEPLSTQNQYLVLVNTIITCEKKLCWEQECAYDESSMSTVSVAN